MCCLVSCSSTFKYIKTHTIKYPTEYQFSVPIDTLRKLFIKEFSTIDSSILSNKFSRKTFSNVDFAKMYYLHPDVYDENDTICDNSFQRIFIPMRYVYDEAVLHLRVWHPIGLSYNYRFIEEDSIYSPLYKATFLVLFSSVNQYTTLARVKAICPRIAIGYRYTYNFHNDETKEVIWEDAEPSTIEEYQILLRIGKALGVQDSMPKLMVPVVH